MKHIKLFEQFINEMEIGKTLFSKPHPKILKHYPYFKKEELDWDSIKNKRGNQVFINALKMEFGKWKDEANTEDEIEFLYNLFLWINSAKSVRLKDMNKDMKFLLKLKKKFPLILDPKEANNVEPYVWRGGTVSIKKAKELLGKLKTEEFVFPQAPNDNRASITKKFKHAKVKTNISSRALKENGAISFSTDARTGLDFMKATDRYNWYERIPCILEVSSSSPNLLFNPDFLNLFTDYNEYETLYIGNESIKVDGIWLPETTEEWVKYAEQHGESYNPNFYKNGEYDYVHKNVTRTYAWFNRS